jgi:phage tail tape-measure protein
MVGSTVGLSVGSLVGVVVGRAVGGRVGKPLGPWLGTRVGRVVGTRDGGVVGTPLGTREGRSVGDWLGNRVGASVGSWGFDSSSKGGVSADCGCVNVVYGNDLLKRSVGALEGPLVAMAHVLLMLYLPATADALG